MSDWPRWFYHHTEPDGRIFYCAEDVPDGWVSGPHLIKQPEDSKPKPPPLPNWDEEDNDEPQKRKPGRPRKE